MSLRFNSREVAFLAHSAQSKFDKEGILRVKEKQEGLFRKGEVFVDRLFRLRGNLLFYFKTKEPASEVLGVLILERCVVQLDPDEDLLFSFILDFEDQSWRLAAHTERERDSWIESLHIASYECLHMQLESLRERIREKTGRDPIECSEPLTVVENVVETRCLGEPFVEISVSCNGLPMESNGRAPDTFASVHFTTPPNPQWITHAHTEILQRCNSPVYLTTVGFDDPNVVTVDTKIKVIIYEVKERMTNTMTQIGNVHFVFSDLLNAPGHKLNLPLQQKFSFLGLVNEQSMGSDCAKNSVHDQSSLMGKGAGVVTVQAWKNSTSSYAEDDEETSDRLLPLRPLYENFSMKTFRFPTNAGGMLRVQECMAECTLTFCVPMTFLKLRVEEEKRHVQLLQEIGEMADRSLVKCLQQSMQHSLSRLNTYTQCSRYLVNYQGAPFKPSVKKGHKEVEFAPTNLHLHRILVQPSDTDEGGFIRVTGAEAACYDTITVGAFTAYSHKYKHGGLRRLLQQLKDSTSETSDGRSTLEQVNALLVTLGSLTAEVTACCDNVCRAVMHVKDAAAAANCLADKTRQLIEVCAADIVEEGLKSWMSSRPGDAKAEKDEDRSSWKWSGTDYVLSPTDEPWELTRLNTEASLVCVLSKVDELSEKNSEGTQCLEDLSPLVIKLKRCVTVLSSRARSSLTFISIKECGPNVALMHTIKYRRDVVFCQALTAAIAGFATKFTSNFTDRSFLNQLMKIGILLNFESLLSCHSDELGMLEDYSVGARDLEQVTFIVRAKDNKENSPEVHSGKRGGYVVHIFLPLLIFQSLPLELQRGRQIRVTSVIFSVGINEQATLAERFGDTTVQEMVNAENYRKLHAYHEKYQDIVAPSDEAPSAKGLPLEQMLRHLHINVMSKKTKNVEILHFAAEICRKMNGIRFVSCKSAKDRTSMAVTLECIQILQREQDLASHAFLHALECLRSEGVRRENTVKNTGVRKYAFNSLQLLSIPKLYRPPNGTFGNVQT